MKNLFLIFVLLSLCVSAFGQQSTPYTLKGIVKDSLSGVPVEFATVALKRVSDGKIIGTVTTDNTGLFEFKRVPAVVMQVNISYMGYHSLERRVQNNPHRPVLDLGNIMLHEDATRLSDVVVSAIGNPIVFKKDTIEYNASSYKMTENAMLEDLVKQLPGAEIDSDGKITVNGKEITKIMIDGQTFFADDPQIASKNLPAKMVEKLQVVDRKSDQAQFTGIDDGEEETVLNLTVKPGMKNGWMGNVNAGAGYKDRYQGGGFVARFDNNWQLSFVGSGNNTNNRGFTDIAGSMMQSGSMRIRGGRGGSQGGFNLNVGGVNMNIGGNGITTSWLAGLNGVLQANPGLKIGGNYFYSGSDNKVEEESARENIFINSDDNFFYNQLGRSHSQTQGHRAALEFEYTLDSLNSFIFKPNFSTGVGNFEDISTYHSIKAAGDSVNYGNSLSAGNNDYLSTSGNLLWRHKFNRPGRTFSINFSYGYDDNKSNGRNESMTHLFAGDSTNKIQQQYNTNSNSYNTGGRMAYTEPLGNNYFVELAYALRHSKSSSGKTTYNMLEGGAEMPDLGSSYDNTFTTQTAEVNLRSVREKYNYVIGANMQPYYMHSQNFTAGTYTGFSRNSINFAPTARFIYNYSDFQQLRINYRARTRQPSMTQLQPVPDNSNPLRVNLGNSELNPEFSHRLQLMYRNTDPQTFRTIVAFANANYTFNNIVNAGLYTPSGQQIIIPVNTDDVYSANARLMINTPITKDSKFYIMSNTGVNFNQTISYTGNIDQYNPDSSIQDLLSNTYRNNTKNLNINERIRLNYKGTKLDAAISGRANWTQAWYSTANQAATNYWSNAVGANFNWTLPWDITLAGDANYNFYIGYSSGYNRPVCLWNAELSKQLFKNKQGTLSVKIYDILNEGRGSSRTTTNNYIEETNTNTLGRYIMFGFTYRFGSFGGQNTQRGPGRGPGGRGFRRPI